MSQPASNSNTAPSQALRARLAAARHVVLDMDGTIYHGGPLFPCTQPFLRLLGELGIGHTFLTNNSSRSTAEYLALLHRLGLAGATAAQIQTSTGATLDWLRRNRPNIRRIFCLGTAGLASEFTAAGFMLTADSDNDAPDAVVVGFDTTLSYPRLCRAAYWISRGLPFIATHPDRICPTSEPTVLVDCGAICAALTSATGRAPDQVFGKPDPSILQPILHRHGVTAAQTLVVGDRLYTDVALARAAGAIGVLVLSGETTAEQARTATPPPDIVAADLADLGEMLRSARA